MENSLPSQFLISFANIASNFTKYILLFAIILDRVGSKDLVQIFIFTKSLSVIVHGMIIKVRYPGNVSYFLERFMEVITFDYLDFIQYSEIIDWQNFIEKSGLSEKVN